MLRKTLKPKALSDIQPKAKRPVLHVPKPKKSLVMSDVKVKKITRAAKGSLLPDVADNIIKRPTSVIVKLSNQSPVAKDSPLQPLTDTRTHFIPLNPLPPLPLAELIPEVDTVKSQAPTQPFISSFIIKQKLRLRILPKAATTFKLTALALLCIIVTVPAMSAFEAHIVNVTADLKEITPPTLTPPGSGTAWDDTNGGSGLSGNVNVVMSDPYVGAPDIYYTFQTGTLVAGLVPDPVCGQTGPNGGGGDKTLPQALTINSDTVIKAIACDGTTAGSNKSYINTKIYSFGQPVNNLVINEFLPNPTGTPSGNQGVSGGHTTGNGGEWVELFNNGTSTLDTDGFVLYDNFVPSSTPSSITWTTNSDFNFNPAPVKNNTTVSGGSVVMLATQTSGTFEKVFDIGTNKQATWGSLSLASTETDPLSSICPAVATSDDGVTYTSYTNLLPCANATTTSISSSLAAVPASRFLKWKAAFTRVNTSTMVNLDSLTVNYNFVDYNTYHELVITTSNIVNSSTPGSTIMPPGDFLVVYRDGNPNFDLNTQANSVSLYDGHLYLGAALIDSHAYNFNAPIPVNHSIARIPDGSSNWVDPCPTPGAPNVATCVDLSVLSDSSATSTATSTLDVLPPADNSTSTVGDASTTPDSTTTPGTIGGGSAGTDGGASPPIIEPAPDLIRGGVPAAGGEVVLHLTTQLQHLRLHQTPQPLQTPPLRPQ